MHNLQLQKPYSLTFKTDARWAMKSWAIDIPCEWDYEVGSVKSLKWSNLTHEVNIIWDTVIISFAQPREWTAIINVT